MFEMFKKKSKKIAMALVGAVTMVSSTCMVFASETPPDVTQIMTTSFTKVANDLTSMVAVGLPIIMGVVGIFFVVRKGITWFKSTTNKA